MPWIWHVCFRSFLFVSAAVCWDANVYISDAMSAWQPVEPNPQIGKKRNVSVSASFQAILLLLFKNISILLHKLCKVLIPEQSNNFKTTLLARSLVQMPFQNILQNHSDATWSRSPARLDTEF